MAPFPYLLLALFTWLAAVAGAGADFVTYHPEAQQLRFHCPTPESLEGYSLLQALVDRLPANGGPATRLAEWGIVQGQGRGKSLHERARVPDNATDHLEATLEHVSCHDSINYTYRCIASSEMKRIRDEQSFKFVGEISQPIITQDPLKSRYSEGDVLSLNCTASVGTADNGIVWEAGFPEGGDFSPVTGVEDPTTGRAYEEENVALPHCVRRSHFPLLYRVTAGDDGKVFQCRLRRSGQTTRIIIAVENDRDKCATTGSENSDNDNLQNSGTEQRVMDLEVTKPRTEYVRADTVSEGQTGGPQSTSTWQVAVIVILVAMVIGAVSAFLVYRRRTKKQPLRRPVEGRPAPTPPLPIQNTDGMAERRRPTTTPPATPSTTPKWPANSHYPHLENSLLPPHLHHHHNNNNNSDTLSESIYVSMTAVDRLGEPQGPAPAPAPARAEAESLETVDMLPDLRLDGKESVYSNQAAVKGEKAGGSVAAVAVDVDAAAVLERLKLDDGESVCLPSVIESMQ
ncbi:uncharacterized protein LOC143281185 isoform X2 [Babylonia areolata]|uniref:uncharacterized protein LOC143281185 isoform X2 n=1 Tax=Babylonia areolata TaxID=304850 RepID=UPI003FD076FA